MENEGIVTLASCFSDISNLEVLSLDGNLIEYGGIKTIYNEIYNLPFLTNLSLVGNLFGKEGLIQFLDYTLLDSRKLLHNDYIILCRKYPIANLDKTIFFLYCIAGRAKMWICVEVKSQHITDFMQAMKSGGNIFLYCTVIKTGAGTLPDEIKTEIEKKYPFIY